MKEIIQGLVEKSKTVPFSPILTSYIISLLLAYFFPFPTSLWIVFIWSLLLLSFLLGIKRKSSSLLPLCLSLFLLGYSYGIVRFFSLKKTFNKVYSVKGVIIDLPVYSHKRWKFDFLVKEFQEGGEWVKEKVKVKVYFYGELPFRLEPGDCLWLKKVRIQETEESKLYLFLKRKKAGKRLVVKGRENLQFVGKEYSLWVLSSILREKCKNWWKSMLSPSSSQLLLGLLLGGREVEKKTKEIFIESGVMHLLAVSGLHVGIVAFFLYSIFKALGIAYHTNAFLTLMGVLFYVFLVGFPPSALRASFIVGLYFLGSIGRRKFNFLNTLQFCAFALLLWQPSLLFDLGFQLSFLITFFLFYLTPHVDGFLSFLPLKLRRTLSVSLSAQISAFPLLVYNFGHFSLAGVFLSIILLPFLFLLLGGGITFPFLNLLFPKAGSLEAVILEKISKSTLLIIERFSGLPFYLHLPSVNFLFPLFFYFLLLSLPILRGWKRIFPFFPLILGFYFPQGTDVWEFIPLKKGFLATFIQERERIVYLGVKGWNEYNLNLLKTYLRSKGWMKVDYVLLSQSNWENFVPVLYLSRYHTIKKVIVPEEKFTGYEFLREKFPLIEVKRGEEKEISDFLVYNSSGLTGEFKVKGVKIFLFPQFARIEKGNFSLLILGGRIGRQKREGWIYPLQREGTLRVRINEKVYLDIPPSTFLPLGRSRGLLLPFR